MLNYFPKFFTSKAITLYFAVLATVSVVFLKRILPFQWMIFGIAEVLFFFHFSNLFTRQWLKYSSKAFEKKLFKTSLIIRVLWVLFSYFFYLYMTGKPFEFSTGDAHFYNTLGDRFATSSLNIERIINVLGLSDSGYVIYLTLIKKIISGDIIITRIIKAILSSFMSVIIYRLATRNFGEDVGRISGIFVMLMPNLILYTGLHLKEVEMVFLVVAFVERADYVIRTKHYNFINIALPILLAGLLFMFRTVLGVTALFAMLTTLLFSSKRVLGMGKRTVLIVWILLAIAYLVGGRIATEIEEVWADRDINQQTSMEWRAERKGGNEFAKYASGVVFAPMIFVIPFPTIINTPGQENQQLIHGGNYVKNIMAFFTVFALFLLIKEKKWREHLLIGSFTIGYLAVIAMSAFAHSERFHLPALPFVMLLAAYGVARADNKTKKYFTWWLGLIFVAIVGWSWFKLAGRGLV